MYDFIEGTLEAIEKESVTIANGGIGYRIVLGKDSPIRMLTQGARVRIWTELLIREDKHELYGFASPLERTFFRTLQEVSGVGPKVALHICNAPERELLIQAIAAKNSVPLQQLPGIGKKLAERIVVDLHEKILKIFPLEVGGENFSENQRMMEQAKHALKTLGFTEEEAKARLKKASKEKPKSCEELIQKALQDR